MKRSRNHRWCLTKNECPQLPDHSKAKHIILSEYIKKYLCILSQSHRIPSYNINLIDGFAGGGLYQNNDLGSPLVMINSVYEAIYEININRSIPIDILPKFFFIEQDKRNFEYLRSVIDRDYPKNKDIILRNDDFNSSLQGIIECVQRRNPRSGGRAIFFLDQDGYTAVNMETLRIIRKKLPKAEIIINISIGWLYDFIDNSPEFRSRIDRMGLTNFVNLDEIIRLKNECADNRYIIESQLSIAIQRATKFPYFRPFFIQPRDNHRGYWLLHLSPHFRAHNAMSEVTWNQGNYMRHYGGDGAKIFELSYKGGVIDYPTFFGATFNSQVKENHLEGLARDLPEIIWNSGKVRVNHLIETTCNNTAASQEMYKDSIVELKKRGEIIILGKKGGKKRKNSVVNSDDLLVPNKQRSIFDLNIKGLGKS